MAGTANPVAGIDIIARLDQFKREMAQVPGIGEQAARQMATKLSQEIKAAERAAKQASEAAKRGKKDIGDLGDIAGRAAAQLGDVEKAAGKTGERLGKVRGFVSMLNPELGELVGEGADVADVFEVATGMGTGFLEILGRLVPVAAVAGAALVTMTKVVDDYSAAKEEATRRERAFVEALQPLDAALDSARTQHELLTQAQAAGKDGLKEYTEIAEIHARVDGQVAEATAGLRAEMTQIVKARADGTRESRSEQIQNDARLKQIKEQIDTVERQGDALKSLEEANRGLREQIDAVTDSTKKSTDAKSDDTKATLSEEEEVIAMRERLAAREAARRQELISSESQNALEWQEVLTQVEEDQTKKKLEEVKKRTDAEKAAAAEVARIHDLQLSAAGDLYGSIAAIAGTAASAMTERQKATAMALFEIQQAAGSAQVVINGIQAVSEASTSAPWPANLLPMAAAAGQAAAQEAAILAVPPPTFNDTPQVMQMGTRGNVSLGAGDFFAAARDPRELQRQVMGMDPHADYRDGGPTVAIVGARAFGRRVRDDLRLRTPLQRAIFGGRATGMRSR